MNKEDQIFDLLERLYLELQDTKKELKEDIKVLNDNQKTIFDKLEKIDSDVESIKEEMLSVQMITADNYKNIVKLKSIK